MENGLLTRDAILGKNKLKLERVTVPGWDGDVMIREFTAAERDEVESWMYHPEGTPPEERRESVQNLRARIAVKALSDESGVRIFTDEDAVHLGNKSAQALDTIFDAALRLSGMTKEEREKIKKNLKPQAAGDGSTTV